jgi:glycosyltransferase involved in cell wall biosynthesis
MRVGVNCLFMIPGEVGGAEIYLRRTLSAMARKFPEVELVLFTNRENDDALREDLSGCGQVRFVQCGFRAMNRFARIVREQTELPLKVSRSGVDLLWSPGYTAPRFLSCPKVTSILDMQYKNHPEDLTFLARTVTDILVSSACRRSSAIIAISDFSRGEIAHLTGTPKERIHVTHLAGDPSFAGALAPGALRERLVRLLGEEGPFLLAVSNTYPHKNIDAAVRSFGELMESIPHRLVLVGQPRLGEKEVQKAVADLPDTGRLVRLDYLSDRDDLRALYQGADVFLFPSLYEGFGLPVLEAMMAGVPVITTKCGAIEEVAGGFAVQFDPGKPGDLTGKISEVLSWGKEEKAAFVSQAREWSGGFSWEKTAVRTMEAIKSAYE